MVIEEINDTSPVPVRLTPHEPVARSPAFTVQMVAVHSFDGSQ